MKGRRLKRGFISLLLVAVLAMSSMTVFAAGDNVAKIGDTEYATLQEAINAAPKGAVEATTIELLKDAKGTGVVVNGQNIVIDFNGYTYEAAEDPLAGSSGTKSQAFQLKKGSVVTMKDGKITSEVARVLIQNYCDLTLEDMILDGTKLQGVKYVMSNNNGSTVITGKTDILAAEDGVAFDVYYWPSYNYNSVSVTFDENYAGTVTGTIEYGAETLTDPNWTDNATLTMKAGTFDSDLVVYGYGLDAGSTQQATANINVLGGVYKNNDFESYVDATEDWYYDDTTKEGFIAVELTLQGVLDGSELQEAIEVVKVPKGYVFTEEDIEDIKDLDLGDEDITLVALAWDKEGTDAIAAGDAVTADDTLYIVMKTVEETPAPQDPSGTQTPTTPQTPATPQNPTTPQTPATPESPKTGDVSYVGLYFVIFAAAAVAVGGFSMRRVVR